MPNGNIHTRTSNGITMSKPIPKPGTTVILRKRPFTRTTPSLRPTIDVFAIIREINHHDVRMELKGQPFEVYIPIRFLKSAGSTLDANPPVISIPDKFTIETLPL